MRKALVATACMTKSWQFRPARGKAGALALVISSAGAGFAAAQDAGQTGYRPHLMQECTGCHRIDGIDNGIPSIIGWPVEAFITTMRYYQSGARSNPVMVSVANSLDEKQLAALAAYFASLPKPAPKARPKIAK